MSKGGSKELNAVTNLAESATYSYRFRFLSSRYNSGNGMRDQTEYF